jgi:error-prone DNA polymerase
VKMRAGMDANGITGEVQEAIIKSITSFALYGFPESHAASFALLAYASGYLKCHYLAAYMAAMLNNQPMGFYHPATLVKDAQRHGLRVLPVDVMQSEWACTITPEKHLRLGLRYVRGLREDAGRAVAAARPFTSIEDMVRRVPGLRKDELRMLAKVGALNFINGVKRRDALWDAERARRSAGPLFETTETPEAVSPLPQMTDTERLHADFTGVGLTVGRHPMAFYRAELDRRRVVPASELPRLRNGSVVRVAGAVIVRQRPGTAHGFLFISLEDETGISNIIVSPDMFARQRALVTERTFIIVDGILQNQQGSISIRAARVEPFDIRDIPVPAQDYQMPVPSHDFH